MHRDSSAHSLPAARLQLVQIVPRLPPVPSGVGDYAYLLAHELRASHGIDTLFLVCDRSWNGGNDIDGFRVEQIENGNSDDLERRISAIPASAPVMLHYVGYGYQKRGCPLWLVQGLEAWKQKHFNRRLLAMFHELYAFGPPWRSSFWNSPLQRWITARLARLSDVCRSNYRLAAIELERLAPEQFGRIDVFPVFSNFGEPSKIEALQCRPPQGVICGTVLRNAKQTSARKRIFEKACRYLGIEKVVFFGASEAYFEIPDIPTERKYVLSPSAASALLLESRIGILDYPDHCLGKSGVFASYCAHGMLPVLVSSDGSAANEVRPGQHYLRTNDIDAPVSLSRQQSVASNACHWYGDHNLATTAASLAETIYRLTPPPFVEPAKISGVNEDAQERVRGRTMAEQLAGDFVG